VAQVAQQLPRKHEPLNSEPSIAKQQQILLKASKIPIAWYEYESREATEWKSLQIYSHKYSFLPSFHHFYIYLFVFMHSFYDLFINLHIYICVSLCV
jgi:hypothetical protein